MKASRLWHLDKNRNWHNNLIRIFDILRQAWRRGDPGLHIFILVLLSAGLWIGTCGLWNLWGPDEGRYVQLAKELLERNNWFHLTVYGEPYEQKPPLAFWMLAGILKLTGGEISSWALRLPSVLSAILMVLLTYGIGRHLFGSRAGMLSALVIVTTPLVLKNAPAVKLDMMFAGFIALALYPWLTRPKNKPLPLPRTILMWGALAGAFFIKGPLAIFIVVSVLLTEAWVNKSWRQTISQSRLVLGLLAVLLLVGGWLWIDRQGIGAELVGGQVTGETLQRLLHGAHANPFWYYIPRLFTTIMFPWALILIPIGFRIGKQRRSLPPGVLPLLGWFLPSFLLLCLAHGKREAYMLPLIPPLSLLIGLQLDIWINSNKVFPKLTKLLGLTVGVLSAAIIIGSVFLVARPEIVLVHRLYVMPANMWAALMVGILLLVVAWGLIRCPRGASFVFYSTVSLISLVAVLDFVVIRPAFNLRKSTRIFSRNLSQQFPELRNHGVLGALGKAAKPEYHVYGNYRVIPVEAREASFAEPKKLPSLLVGEREEAEKLGPVLGDSGYRWVYSEIVSGDALILFSPDTTGYNEPNSHQLRFAITGDTRSGDYDAARIADQMVIVHELTPLTAVFLLGDNLNAEKDSQFSLVAKHQFLDPFRSLLKAGVPIHAVLGNHDYSAGFVQDEIHFAPFGMNGRRYYTKSYGNGAVTFFLSDSQTIKEEPEQLQWLASQVSICESRWKILLIHHPIYGSEKPHKPSRARYRLLMPIITGKNGIDVVFSAHNHVYERLALHKGIQFITAGAGGQLETGAWPENPNRLAEYNDMRSFVVMELSGDRLSLRAINELGEVVDSVTLRKTNGVERLVTESHQTPVESEGYR